MKVDVHIIKSDRGYFDECMESIKDEPINLHLLEHSEGEHGKLRIEGFKKGDSPYVALIDDDDVVIPGVFQRAIDVMEQGYSAYYSNHYVMDAEGNVYGRRFTKPMPPIGYSQWKQMHHVVVYRRDIITPILHLLDGVQLGDKLLLNLKSIYDGRVFGENRMGLYWRVHEKSMHKTRFIDDNPQEWHDAVEDYKNKLLARVK